MTISRDLQHPWLSILGIGEDGLEGLSSVGRSLLSLASVIVGGERHLAMLPPENQREKLLWTSPIENSVNQIIHRRGQAVCVLASGDPMCYGIGVTLTRHIPITEITIIPSPSTFSLACSRLGWSLTEVETLSLCGRPPALLNAVLYQGAKLLVLSADAQTPAIAAQILTRAGWGDSLMVVLEHLGGTQERQIEGIASSWHLTDIADLNAIAITCISSTPLTITPRLPGLPDTAYQHDGQLTKREIRAITLTALAPLPGQLLWDVGAGCGSIGIEWMRSDRRCLSIAIEQHPTRLQYIANNANTLGTPHLKIVAGKAPIALKDLPQPDAIFIGGGITVPELFETCWQALRSGGRLVANTVTVESELILFQWHSKLGGELIRIGIQRAEPVGKFLGWKAMAPVTQWVVVKD
jgi:precorrin-6Y C5,15-methyltransferase (decarboxylating)